MKKSIVISLLTVIIIFCTALGSFASTGIVTTDTLRVREEASTTASIVTLLSVNDEVEILEEVNGWYKVQSGEYVGYVAAEYIELLTNSDEEVNEETNTEENPEEDENEETVEETETSTNVTTVKIITKDTKIYVTPLINSMVMKTTENEEEIEIISEINGWSYIKGENIKGWVMTDDISDKTVEVTETVEAEEPEENNTSSQKTGYISGSSVNFREEANSTANVISSLSRNTQITVIEEGQDGWTKIEYNGQTGYVASDYISDTEVSTTSRSASTRTSSSSSSSSSTKATTTATSSSSSSSSSSATGAEIVAYAKKYLGSKYVYGGSSPSTGFDCSGFTTYVFKHFGYSLSRSSSAQASNGTAVSKSNLQAGDIICFSRSSSSSTVGHVGIYIGNGQFIHAANSRKGVIISNVSGDGYYYVCARRII